MIRAVATSDHLPRAGAERLANWIGWPVKFRCGRLGGGPGWGGWPGWPGQVGQVREEGLLSRGDGVGGAIWVDRDKGVS